MYEGLVKMEATVSVKSCHLVYKSRSQLFIFNPLKTIPKYTQLWVYGKCVLKY